MDGRNAFVGGKLERRLGVRMVCRPALAMSNFVRRIQLISATPS